VKYAKQCLKITEDVAQSLLKKFLIIYSIWPLQYVVNEFSPESWKKPKHVLWHCVWKVIITKYDNSVLRYTHREVRLFWPNNSIQTISPSSKNIRISKRKS